VTLWRPRGPAELELVEASGRRAWPARLPDQPTLYPCTTGITDPHRARLERHGQRCGYLTRFEIRIASLDQHEVHQAGGRTILE